MPPKDFFSPKAIANRIKAKGLQKLKFYCQMCQKQCRDDNGFKCHQMTDAHARMMSIFAENPDKFMDNFSEDFEGGYLAVLSRQFGTRRVNANQVYNEYIHDKEHVHMNSTIWPTLSEFVKYLGRTGKCVIDETERGWFVSYIERDPEVIARQERAAAREVAEMDEDARRDAEIEARIAAVRALAALEGDGPSADAAAGMLRRTADDAKVKFSFSLVGARGGGAAPSTKTAPPPPSAAPPEAISGTAVGVGVKRSHPDATAAGAACDIRIGGCLADDAAAGKRPRLDAALHALAASAAPSDTVRSAAVAAASGGPAVNSTLRALMAEDAAEKLRRVGSAASSAAATGGSAMAASAPAAAAASSTGEQPWLRQGIVVKILNKRVAGGRYYKAKAEVRVVDAGNPFVATLQVLPPPPSAASGAAAPYASGDLLKMDQADCETVLPPLGEPVVFVRGPRAGAAATLLRLHVEEFCATVQLPGPGGATLRVDYEDICKASAVAGRG